MRPGRLAMVGALILWPSLAHAQDPLARARQLYNDRRFEAAALAAEEARSPERTDVVDLIVARSYLERYRESYPRGPNLTAARERLRRINPARLNEAERTEYLVGLGEDLFLEGASGAAANIFDTLFESPGPLTAAARERVLDWWATAVDRDARPRADIDRQPLYQKIRDRMRDELAQNPGSAVASYWLSAAACGLGDYQAAWDAAMAGWVRSAFAVDQGVALRAELDALVQRLVVPQRARVLAQPPEQLLHEWEAFKTRWQR